MDTVASSGRPGPWRWRWTERRPADSAMSVSGAHHGMEGGRVNEDGDGGGQSHGTYYGMEARGTNDDRDGGGRHGSRPSWPWVSRRRIRAPKPEEASAANSSGMGPSDHLEE